MTIPVIRANDRATRRVRPLTSRRIPLLRRGHVALAVIVWMVHESAHGFTDGRVALALLAATIWYGALRWTLLRESRAAPSFAFTIVRTLQATLIAGVSILAVHAVFVPADSVSVELFTLAEMALLTLLWQLAVAGNHTLGEPLRTVVIGPSNVVEMIESEKLAPGARPFELVGWIDDPAVDEQLDIGAETLRLGAIEELERISYGGGIDLFVVGVRSGRPALYGRLLELTHLDVSVIEFPAFFERSFGRVPLNELTPTWFLHTMHLHRRDESSFMKRALDLVLASVGLVLGAPLMIAAAIWIRLESPGSVLFRQVRIGEHGRRFTMLKMRSMRVGDANDGNTWTGDDDTRITRSGALLRRFRIDELPQLFNVIRGEMTLVGPRPETPGYVRWLAEEIPFYKPRHFGKPGITGWAQVCAGYAASIEDTRTKLSYDLYYLRNQSLAFDLAIILRTFATILGGRGAK